MKTRLLIIIGIVILSTVPFATIIILDRYENYLEQLEYERLAIENQPKPGERSYIEPVLKAKLEKVELELRDKVKELHEGLPPSSYAVNLNHQTKEIEAMIENRELIPIIKEFTTKYPDDITIIVEYGGISIGLPFEKIDTLERILESCSGKFGIPLEKKTLWINETHKITSDSCELEKRFNSGVSIDRNVYSAPSVNSWHNNQMNDVDLQSVIDSCANETPKERMRDGLRYTNETHVFMNHGCEWKRIGYFVGD